VFRARPAVLDERAVLHAAEAMSATPACVSEVVHFELRQHLDEGRIIELISAIPGKWTQKESSPAS
jgi:alkylhydroperoxidase family enzyme